MDELPASSTLDILIGGMGMALVGISGCWDNDVEWTLKRTESGPWGGPSASPEPFWASVSWSVKCKVKH